MPLGLLLPAVSINKEALAETLAVHYQFDLALVELSKHLNDRVQTVVVVSPMMSDSFSFFTSPRIFLCL